MSTVREVALRRGGVAFVLVLFLLLADLGVSAARAEPSNFDLDEVEIRQAFDDLGVDGDVQDSLIAKLQSGQLLDSDAGVKPVDETELAVDGATQVKATYPDGSVSVTTVGSEYAVASAPGVHGVEVPAITPMSVSGCQAIPNSGGWIRRTNCAIKWDSATMGFGFVGNYSVKSGAGRVDGAWARDGWYYNRLPGRVVDSHNLRIGRTVSTSSHYAWARLYYRTIFGGISTTRYLEFRVKGSAWSAVWSN